MIDKKRIEQEIKLIDKNVYCFDKYELDVTNRFVTLLNFHYIKSSTDKLNLILELENGYPTKGHFGFIYLQNIFHNYKFYLVTKVVLYIHLVLKHHAIQNHGFQAQIYLMEMVCIL